MICESSSGVAFCAVLVVTFAIGVWRYPHLPEVLAPHFSTSGVPSGLEPKSCGPMLALSENLDFLSANTGPFLSAAIVTRWFYVEKTSPSMQEQITQPEQDQCSQDKVSEEIWPG